MNQAIRFIFLAATLSLSAAAAQEPGPPNFPGGQVTLPLNEYQQLFEQSTWDPQPAPSAYAIGRSDLKINYRERDRRVTATVEAQVQVETFRDGWTLVDLLQPGAALEAASVNGEAVQLVQRADGLFWLAEGKQKATLRLVYHVDAHYSEHAYVSALPVPRAAATGFEVHIPRQHIDLSVAPVTNLEKFTASPGTTARGTLPPTASITLSWRVAQDDAVALSRASYSGAVQGDAITWNVRYQAEVLSDSEVSLPLLSTAVILIEAKVDGEPASVFDLDGRFAVRLSGAGRHTIDIDFQSPLAYPDGVPSTGFAIPRVPVSRFDLSLPGDKQVRVQPAANVAVERSGGTTRAIFFTRLDDAVALTWMEAIPEDVAVQTRANAGVFQALHATEGVLYGLASIRYEFTRGDANVVEFILPKSAQVNRITSPEATVADWITLDSGDPLNDHIRVFLDRVVSGEFALNVSYEQLLDEQLSALGVPLLRAAGVARQNGMLALLSGADLALSPVQHADMAEVGENQLPAFFRNQLAQTVSHTYKYHSEAASLSVRPVTPERRQGKFNAQIDTLISIGEVTLKGSVSIENDVKSGVLRELRLVLPADLNILGINGPSIRSHTVSPADGAQQVDIEFTQEMDGQFHIELNYERIMVDELAETEVPWVEVVGADVAHGRVAIEALAALEVQPSRVEQLSSLEINELPRQLILKTTNPILLAYKYVKTEQPISLGLKITRHQEIDVQVAAIDTAHYQTLYTRDGLAVTRAMFNVRNSRRQFLRLALPAEATIWSVFVNGRAQKPAFAGGEGAGPRDVLIKMVNSSSAFPVELIYATPGEAMVHFGTVAGQLPRPDMIVTHTDWEVYVPKGPRYAAPRTNMEVIAGAVVSVMQDASLELLRAGAASIAGGEPLRLQLPIQGLKFRFAKLYANQAADDAFFALRYVDQGARQAGAWLSLLAVLMLWGGIVLLALPRPAGRSNVAYGLVGLGAISAVVAIGPLGAAAGPPSVLALAVAVLLGGALLYRRLFRRQAE